MPLDSMLNSKLIDRRKVKILIIKDTSIAGEHTPASDKPIIVDGQTAHELIVAKKAVPAPVIGRRVKNRDDKKLAKR